jgi:hypothetical protein
MFFAKSIAPFQKWTKKMSKIEKPKYFWNHFFFNNIIISQNNLKKNYIAA